MKSESEKQSNYVASLIGDKSRFSMLWQLLDGRAYTATELSVCADISAQSASNHLLKLVKARILSVTKQGRHRYYIYANQEVPGIVESIAGLAAISSKSDKLKMPVQNELTYARTCYDHLAGKVAVDISDTLIKNGKIEINGKKCIITSAGIDWFIKLGLNIQDIKLQKRSFAHQCLDWSERRYHIAGALGASMLNVMLKNDWVRKKRNSREVIITSIGKSELNSLLGIEI